MVVFVGHGKEVCGTSYVDFKQGNEKKKKANIFIYGISTTLPTIRKNIVQSQVYAFMLAYKNDIGWCHTNTISIF